MGRLLAAVLALLVLSAPVAGATSRSVSTSWASPQIASVVDAGLMGTSVDDFRPDDPLTAGTFVKAAHITQLRTAVNAVRAVAGLSAATFTDAAVVAGTTTIKATHLRELRHALNQGRASAGLSYMTYTDMAITTPPGRIKAAHVTDLRNAVK